MQLRKVRIQNFQSVMDSNEFDVGDVTCLVGKNEAGKTAILKALYRLNPLNPQDSDYDATHNYPRRDFALYEAEVANDSRKPANVVTATFVLGEDDVREIATLLGKDSLPDHDLTLTLSRGYSNVLLIGQMDLQLEPALRHLASSCDLSESLATRLRQLSTAQAMLDLLQESEESTSETEELVGDLTTIHEKGLSLFVYRSVLKERVPKFLYFDEYYQMKGQDNLDSLLERTQSGALEDSDHPLLGLIGLAGLRLEMVVDADNTETLIARLEAAGNRLTQSVLKYWSQNSHLRMRFDIREARPQDGPGMDQGTNIWGRVEDTRHMVSTALGTRSKGFVWFFSFLAWYDKLRRDGENLILLLDEPGLSLHGRAQADLLAYFEQELRPNHQLLYTTHSPFMVDPGHFDRVRIVQDLSIEVGSHNLSEEQQGTKVSTDVLEATPDSLFPLQGALGYEIHQSLFIGPNCLIVEGVSDLLYIQTLSGVLQKRGQRGLSPDWIVTPVGGADKVPTFVALIGAQHNLNVAVLIDFQKKGQQSIENLYKSKLLKKQQVMTFADFTGASESDIEDMFEPEFYLKLVNGELNTSLKLSQLSSTHPRILQRLEDRFEKRPLPKGAQFNHYRPARYLSESIGTLEEELSDETLDRFQRAFDALNQLL
ncbi:MAG: AAA family ATPase [Chloroflexota bacterium]|nr:AAA family ATPase [Chloroflexota bacterium]